MIDRLMRSFPLFAVVLLSIFLADSRTEAQDSTNVRRIEIARDTWFSGVGREANCNTGASQQCKVKSIQEMTVLDFDPTPLRGRAIRSATLLLRKRGS